MCCVRGRRPPEKQVSCGARTIAAFAIGARKESDLMFTPIALAFVLAVAAPASAEDWTPFQAFMGTWSGTRTGASGAVRVTRDYESIDGNRRVLVSDGPGSSPAPWALVSIDPIRGGFLLSGLGAGGFTELVLSRADGATLMFDTPPGEGGASATRITDELRGPDEFVERIEARTGGAPFTLVSETQFRRKR
jgi:hypothetical protein